MKGIFPTEQVIEELSFNNGETIEVTLVACANPTIFVEAQAMGVAIAQSDAVSSNSPLPLLPSQQLYNEARTKLALLRKAGAERMGLLSMFYRNTCPRPHEFPI